MRTLGAILLLLMGCSLSEQPQSAVHSNEFIKQADTRRTALEYAMWQPALPYSKKLLNNYGLDDSGWELLPEVNLEVGPFRTDDAEHVGDETYDWQGVVQPSTPPSNDAEWMAMGESTFWGLPMRRDAYLRWLLARPDLWSEVGLDVLPDGSVAGIAMYRDPEGSIKYGVTCALCHSSEGLAGRANRRLNIGKARALYAEYMGRNGDDFLTWGPGRIDVTEDGVDNPVAIPDLWGLEHAQFVNHSGSIRVAGPVTLAVRLETQYIQNHRMRSRPPRAQMWALSRYVMSRKPPVTDTNDLDPERVAEGQDVFNKHCGDCHEKDRSYSGGLIPAEDLSVDAAVALSPTRGTGFYKVPSLLGVRANGPYLHDGSLATLADLLASGHPYGQALDTEEQNVLNEFLKSL